MGEHQKKQPEEVRQIERVSLWVSIITGGAAILIALIYGAWGISLSKEQIGLSKEQNATSIDLTHFAQLLAKTDTVIQYSDSLFKVNLEAKKANDSANKFRFIAAIFRLGSVIGTKEKALGQLTQTACAGCADYLYIDILPIFESQLNNPFLCEDTGMLKKWVNAYTHLVIAGKTEQYLISEDGKQFIKDETGHIVESEREHLRIDEIMKVKMEADYLHAWDAANEAYLYCGKKLKNITSGFITP